MSDTGLLFDANVWVALVFPVHPHHREAVAALRSATNASPAIFCRATQQSFLRLASTPALLRLSNATGLTNRDALHLLNRLMESPHVVFRQEPDGLVPVWHHLAARDSASPKVWMDAYLAAFAIAGDLQLVTADRDFASFEAAGLRFRLLN